MALSEKGVKTAKDKIKRDKFIEKFKENQPKPIDPFKPKKPKFERMPLPLPKGFGPRFGRPPDPKENPEAYRKFIEKFKKEKAKKKRLLTDRADSKNKKKSKPAKKFADGGKAESFGMLSVKAGVDNNPNPTQADRIVGATKKKNGGSPTLEKGRVRGVKDAPEERRKEQKKKKKKMPGMLAIGIEIIKPKKPIKAANGGLAGRLAKRGYGKARS